MTRKSHMWALVTIPAALTLLFFVLGGSSLFISTPHRSLDLDDILAELVYPSSSTHLFDIAADFEHIFDLPLYHEPELSLVYGSLFEPPQPPRCKLGLDHIDAATRRVRAFMQVLARMLRSAKLGTAECSNALLKLLSTFYTFLRGGDWCAVAIALAVLLDLSLLLARSARPTRAYVNVARSAPVSTLSIGQRKEVLGLALRGSQVPRVEVLHSAVNMRWLYNHFYRSVYPSPYSAATMLVHVSFPVARLLTRSTIRPEGYTYAPAQARLLIEYNQEKESPVVSDDKPKVEVEVEQRSPAVRKAQREPKFVAYVARPLRDALGNSRKTAQEAATDLSLMKKDRHTPEEQDAQRGNPETRLGCLDSDTVDAAPGRLETVADGGVEGTPKRKRTHRGKRGGRSRSARGPKPEL
ncbi:hypothetical protein FRC06_007506 [Ceratobasidium sp. 370]|nr:hypothetical protein FRC06_007506 [Ceratobasidium sp. 370]